MPQTPTQKTDVLPCRPSKITPMLQTASQSSVQYEALKSGYFLKKTLHSEAKKSTPPKKIKQRVHEPGPQVNQITT